MSECAPSWLAKQGFCNQPLVRLSETLIPPQGLLWVWEFSTMPQPQPVLNLDSFLSPSMGLILRNSELLFLSLIKYFCIKAWVCLLLKRPDWQSAVTHIQGWSWFRHGWIQGLRWHHWDLISHHFSVVSTWATVWKATHWRELVDKANLPSSPSFVPSPCYTPRQLI